MYLMCLYNLYSSLYNEKKCPSCQRASCIWPSLRWLWFPSRPDGSAVWAVCVCGRGAVRRGPAASWREDCSHPGSLLCPRAAVLLSPTWTFNLFNMWQRTQSKTEHMSGGWGSTGRDSSHFLFSKGWFLVLRVLKDQFELKLNLIVFKKWFLSNSKMD